MPQPQDNAYRPILVVCPTKATKLKKNLKATYRRVQTLRISYKYSKRLAPEGKIYDQNSKF